MFVALLLRINIEMKVFFRFFLTIFRSRQIGGDEKEELYENIRSEPLNDIVRR